MQEINAAPLLEVRQNGDNTLILLRTARLDAAASLKLRHDLATHLNSMNPDVIIDMETVEFIDSSGVGCLLGIYKRLSAQHALIKLRNVTARVQSVLELLRLHRIFEITS